MSSSEAFNSRADGTTHEGRALEYLCSLGYSLIQRNFHFGRVGEIDLIMRDGNTWVFVEVKGRRGHAQGLPEDAVTMRKRQTMVRVARGFFHVRGLYNVQARFDVVAIDYTGEGGTISRQPKIRHYREAFRGDGG